MTSELKTIRVLEFDGNASNWDGWSEKFMTRGKRKGYKKLLQGKEKIPTNDEYKLAVLGSSKEDNQIKKNGESNEKGNIARNMGSDDKSITELRLLVL